MGQKIVVKNRRAWRDYHILDTFEAGLVLQGTEVKSLRDGKMVLKDSYADIIKDEVILVGAHIHPYEQGNINNHDPERPRKLLLHRREIHRISTQVAEKGYTLIPLKVYFVRGKAKVELGLCKGKHSYDKRDAIRERDMNREAGREIKDLGHRG